MKVETHNHPTAISPFPGAVHRFGRRDPRRGRDRHRRQAQSRDWWASRSRICASRVPSALGAAAWQAGDRRKPERIASALEIMLEGPLGCRRPSTMNSAGPASTATSAPSRSSRRAIRRPVPRLPQADHDRRRARQRAARADVEKRDCPAGRASSSVLGGPVDAHRPRRRRRLLAGRRRRQQPSSTSTRCSAATRRCSGVPQEVIDRCWARWASPIPSCSSTMSAPAACRTPSPKLVAQQPAAAPSPRAARGAQRRARHDRRWSSWCNESQERYVLVIAPERACRTSPLLCARERCPLAVIGSAHRRRPPAGRRDSHCSAKQPVDMPLDVLLGKPPRMLARGDVAGSPAATATSVPRPARSDPARGAAACAALPGGCRQDFPHHHRRSHASVA
jgi:phosphoribosylformylglycinamidine synthase